MGIKSVGLNGAAAGLDVLAWVPGGVGLGLVFVGTKLVSLSTAMRDKAAEYRNIAMGLNMISAKTVDPAEVEKYAKENNCSFDDALIVVAERAAEKAEKKSDDSAAEVEVKPETKVEQPETKVEPSTDGDDIIVDVKMGVAKIVVEDGDGKSDISGAVNLAAGLA